MDEERTCTGCSRRQPLGQFPFNAARGTRYYRCKQCLADSRARSRARYADVYAARKRAKYAERRQAAIDHYGGRCACCGESEPTFLAIDHTNGGGNAHRREIGRGADATLRWIEKHDFPDGFRVLCHNCNMATSGGKTCPHQIAGNEA
jgi:hypothetical protein